MLLLLLFTHTLHFRLTIQRQLQFFSLFFLLPDFFSSFLIFLFCWCVFLSSNTLSSKHLFCIFPRSLRSLFITIFLIFIKETKIFVSFLLEWLAKSTHAKYIFVVASDDSDVSEWERERICVLYIRNKPSNFLSTHSLLDDATTYM